MIISSVIASAAKRSSLDNQMDCHVGLRPPRNDGNWVEAIPGQWRPRADLSKMNWFGVGGVAEWLYKPESAEQLAVFFAHKPEHLPVTVIGVGSNVLVRGGGVEGVVIRLGRGFAQMRMVEDERVEAGAGCLCANVARFACEQGIGGLEFLSGIPGSIGGALAMNAGAYGGDTASVLALAEYVDGRKIHRVPVKALNYSYRHCGGLSEGAIFTAAMLRGYKEDPKIIADKMQQIARARAETQPSAHTGGSTFKNPPGHKAWQLIERAGCRGLRIGGAQMSEKHCNFMVNTGTATASDLENLGEEVRQRVRAHSGVELEWEIRRVGKAA